MKYKGITLLALLALVVAIFPTTMSAQTTAKTYTSGINWREVRQQRRIRQGERSGTLTHREAGRLEAREARLNVHEAYARRSGGRLTATERSRLQAQLNRNNRAISRQKHDQQGRNARSQSINERQSDQQKRILQGEQSGSLNEREAKRLEARGAKVSVDEAYARQSGGRFTPRERRHIQRELNHSSRGVYRQKHDQQTQH